MGLVGYLGGDKGAGLSRDLSNLRGVVPEPATDPRPKMLMSHHGASVLDTMEPRGFSIVAAGFSGYDGDLSLPLGLALGPTGAAARGNP